MIFIATIASVGSDPLNLISWQEVDSIRYNVGAWEPTVGTEYPDITTGGPGSSGEHIAGAVWFMHNLDPVLGYTFTSGKLAGIQMFNNDKIVFQGEDSTTVPGTISPIWLNEPFPKVKGELGGVPFSSVLDYERGDVTVDYPYMYMALSNQGPTTVRPSTNPAAWQKMNTDLNINLAWDANQAYTQGNVVLYNGVLYYTTQNTPAGSLPTSPPWIVATPPEKGGLLYDSTLVYVTGDIITHGSIAYKCIGGTTGTFDQSKWVNLATDDESGGVQWKTSINYRLGDVVSRDHSPLLFICTKAISQGSDPLNLIDWQEVDSIRYNVGVFTPTAGSEYPDYTTGGPGTGGHHEAGAVWFTDGVDVVTGYTIGSGPLATKIVMNNDKYVFQGMDVTTTPGTPTPIWLYEAFPRVKGEVGGVAFGTNLDYDKGDVVVDFGELYLALVNIPKSTNTPSTTPAKWRLLNTTAGANTTYDPSKAYIAGDLVSHGGKLYLATGNAAAGVTPPTAPWSLAGGEVEVGGKLYSAANKYVLGDMVIYGGSAYQANGITTGVWDSTKWVMLAPIPHTDTFTATAGQDVFPVIYDPATLIVLSDGIEMQPNEYVATNGTDITLNVPVSLDTWIKVSSFI